MAFISFLVEGKFSALHHFLTALSETLYYSAILVNGRALIICFNSSLDGRYSTTRYCFRIQSKHNPESEYREIFLPHLLQKYSFVVVFCILS